MSEVITREALNQWRANLRDMHAEALESMESAAFVEYAHERAEYERARDTYRDHERTRARSPRTRAPRYEEAGMC